MNGSRSDWRSLSATLAGAMLPAAPIAPWAAASGTPPDKLLAVFMMGSNETGLTAPLGN
jgi:hypothetical protein